MATTGGLMLSKHIIDEEKGEREICSICLSMIERKKPKAKRLNRQRREYKKLSEEQQKTMFDDRLSILFYLGFKSYAEYLRSSLWRRIKSAFLELHPYCCCCLRHANQIHHRAYDYDTLAGLSNEQLAPICRKCHNEIEFYTDGSKRYGLEAVNKALNRRVSSFCPLP
jgi:hypothetical protein